MKDFKVFRHGAAAVLHGRSPYGPPDPALLAHNKQFVYPPLAAYAASPFALVSWPVASAAFLAAACAAIVIGLRLLACTDWRCYGLAFLTPPVFYALAVGAIGPFLFLVPRAAWRSTENRLGRRDRRSVLHRELFLWPLVVWLAATRRWGASIGALAVAAMCVLTSWAGIGFAGLSQYPAFRKHSIGQRNGKVLLSRRPGDRSWSPVDGRNGSPRTRRRRGLRADVRRCAAENGDERAFSHLHPDGARDDSSLWIHYLVLLLARSRSSAQALGRLGRPGSPVALASPGGSKVGVPLDLPAHGDVLPGGVLLASTRKHPPRQDARVRARPASRSPIRRGGTLKDVTTTAGSPFTVASFGCLVGRIVGADARIGQPLVDAFDPFERAAREGFPEHVLGRPSSLLATSSAKPGPQRAAPRPWGTPPAAFGRAGRLSRLVGEACVGGHAVSSDAPPFFSFPRWALASSSVIWPLRPPWQVCSGVPTRMARDGVVEARRVPAARNRAPPSR